VHPIVLEDLQAILGARLDWERFRRKTVLVTGANGFLPAYMVETLLHLNVLTAMECHVICLVRNRLKAETRFAQYSGRSDLSFVVGNVSEGIPVNRRCDFVIHAASQASPKYYGRDPVGTMTANILGTYHLLNLARDWRSEGFLFFSSGEVYGHVPSEKIPTSETDYGYLDILNPRSCYAEGKRAGETLTVSYTQQFGMPGVIVRPFHTYGPGMAMDDGRVYADFVSDVVNHRDITLHSDGKAVRAFCYLADAVAGFFTVLLKGQTGQAYNIGNPHAMISIGDLAELLAHLSPDLALTVRRSARSGAGYLPSPVSVNSPNVDRAAALGWRPTFSVQEGFERTIRYFTER
jgi:nucleoside-diphosphate-sugar epimerase